MTKFDLQDMTRRNAHPRADMKDLYGEFGAVLISKYDVGSLLSEQVSTYTLDLEFLVTFDNEPHTEEGVGAQARYTAKIQQPTQTTVLFLYENGSRLEGDTRKMEFVQTFY